MGTKNNNNLFFTCSLIEYIGRKAKRTRREITDLLGREEIERIYEYADVFHCEPIEKVADEFIKENKITAVIISLERKKYGRKLILPAKGNQTHRSIYD